jgi:adrenodoxin-NADP+ reductase
MVTIIIHTKIFAGGPATLVAKARGSWMIKRLSNNARSLFVWKGQDRSRIADALPNRLGYYYCMFSSTSSSSSFSNKEGWKVAIVGSGPSGCYTAKYLLNSPQFASHPTSASNSSNNNNNSNNTIDIFERLPTPYGLVRNGVAPDHPEVKNVQNDFDQLFTTTATTNTSGTANVQFLGNVSVGQDITLQELRQLYDVVVLAFGCESDRSLQHLSGAHLKGILGARDFVNWYNGHPDFEWVGQHVQESLGHGSGGGKNDNNKVTNVVVIGHGNVALDCARILAKTDEELDPTDISTRALKVLNNSQEQQQQIRRISIVGRRGHVQGAFTIKEVRELTKLPHCKFVVKQEELDKGLDTLASQEELKQQRPKQRINKLLQDSAGICGTQQEEEGNPAISQVDLRFLMNPIRFEENLTRPDRLGAVICERTELQGEPGHQSAHGTGEEEIIPADLCLVSIGYKGLPIDGTQCYYDSSRGILRNVHGLVDDGDDVLAPLYVSGWLKRGPSGIIGTNIADAKDTVTSILKDMEGKTPKSSKLPSSTTSIFCLLQDRGIKIVDWESYQRINSVETSPQHKRHPDQPREKLTSWNELLDAAQLVK